MAQIEELSNKEEPALEVSAPDKLEPIFERVKANRFDLEAWETLLRCISSSSSDHLDDLTKEIIGYSLEKLPPIVNLEFSSLFVHAPILNEIFSKPSLWLELIQLVKSQQGGPSLAAVFKNVLCKVRSLELCKKYLSYVKTVRNVSPREQQQKIDSVMTEAYELVLERIGHEIDSGSLWSEYVSYLRSHKPESVYEKQKIMDSIRSAFQRAVCIPISNVEKLWLEYDSFENSLNDLTAKKIISSKSAHYMNARASLCDLKTLLGNIAKFQKRASTVPPKWSRASIQLYDSWAALISWEKSNPMKYEDKNQLYNRIIATYEKAVMQLKDFPEIWYDAAAYCISMNKNKEALSFLEMGMEIIPHSLLLNFYYIHMLEASSKSPAEIYEILDKLTSAIENRIKSLADSSDANKHARPVDQSEEKRLEGGLQADSNSIKDSQQKIYPAEILQEIEDLKLSLAVAWIYYIHSARRIQNIKSARSVFNRARKSPYCSYQVWVASAKMEYYYNKDPATASRVFQAGLKKFALGQDTQLCGLLNNYLDFLISLNDDSNTRAFLLNMVGQSSSKPECKMLWGRSIKYEVENGTVTNILKMEKMREEAFPNECEEDKRLYLMDRWSFLGIDVIGNNELGVKARKQLSGCSEETKTPLNLPDFGKLPLTTQPTQFATSAASIKNDASQQRKKKMHPLLRSIDPEKYPQPDFEQWEPSKTGQTQQPAEPAQPSYPAPHNTLSNILMVYPAIAQLLSVLPDAGAYDGKIPIPLPQATPQMVPLAVPSVPQGDIGTEYSQNILQQSQREAHPEPQIPQLDRASVDGPAGVKQFVQPHNTMVPGLNSMSTQEYIQPPQFEEKWPHNVNWRKRGRPRGGGSGSGGWSKYRSARNFGYMGNEDNHNPNLTRPFKKKMRDANSHPIGGSH